MGRRLPRGAGLLAVPLLTAGIAAAAGEAAIAADNGNVARLAPGDAAQPSTETPPAHKPVRVFTDAQGRTCQVYAHEVRIDNAPQTAYAIICRLQNGRWVLVR